MKVLLTGGAGFIGSHLGRRLIRDGHSVVIVDNLSTGRRDNVPDGAELVEVDLSRAELASLLPDGHFDAVVHLAGQSSGPASAEMPLKDFQANAVSTLLLSRWAISRKIPRFVHASSMAVYGDVDQLPASEATTPCAPRSYYGVSKLAAEHVLRVAAHEGLSTTSLRFFSVYGPGQNLANRKQGIASIYLAYLLEGREVPVTGSLDRFRDLVFIDDVVDLCVGVLTRKTTPSPVYNVGTGRPTTVRELIAKLIGLAGLPADHPVRELPGTASDQFGLYAEVDRAVTDLEWKATTTLERGLRVMIDWARQEASIRQ